MSNQEKLLKKLGFNIEDLEKEDFDIETAIKSFYDSKLDVYLSKPEIKEKINNARNEGKIIGIKDFKKALKRKYELDINKFNAIIEKYNKNSPQKVVKEEIKKYMMYASLFYACQRFNTKFIEKRNVNVKDYNEYLNKFENIEKYLLVD